jgi:hypothetical protein
MFLSLVFLLVVLPTGAVFGVNVKVIGLGIFLGVLLLYLIRSGEWLSFSDVVFLGLVSVFLCIFLLNGVLSGQTEINQSFSQLRDIATTIFISWLSLFVVRRGLVRAESLITVIIYAVLAESAAKLLLMIMPTFLTLQAFEAARSIFGDWDFVTGGIGNGLFRMQLPADILAPFALFALLAPSVSGVRFGRVFSFVICTVALGSGFIAFSRYIWFVYAVAILAAMVVEWNWKRLIATVLVALVISVSVYTFLEDAVELRFQSKGTDISDEIRAEQARALIEEFEDRPILGKGLGSHATAVIRADRLLYSYELQWLAFLMQVGIVGVIGIVALLGASMRDLVMARHSAKPLVLLLFLLWLVSGFTNPYMTNSFAAVTFGLFMALFYRMRRLAPEAQAHLVVQVAPSMPS